MKHRHQMSDAFKALLYSHRGIALPAGMMATPLRRFPTPGKVRDIIADTDKRRMLERLYVEYECLCSFAHGLAEANLLKGIFDPRATHRADVRATDADIDGKISNDYRIGRESQELYLCCRRDYGIDAAVPG